MKYNITYTQRKISERINQDLKTIFSNQYKDLYQDTISIINNGNKFRALMLFYVTKSLNPKVSTRKLLKIASGLEILHRSTLIHDDIVDGDTIRNGVTCLHIQKGLHEGIYIPLILKEYVLKNCITEEPLTDSINNVWSDICKGQILEKSLANRKTATFIEYKKVVKLKSAGFAEFAFFASQYLTNSNNLSIKKIRDLGLDAALLFQIIDDIEDVIDYASTKVIPSDIVNNLKTYVWFLIDSPEKLNNKEFALAMTSKNIVNTAIKDIKKYHNRFLKKLDILLPNNNIYKKLFISVINTRIENRTKKLYKLL
jgi:geranylgeranyl pyrophosphate synthase